MFRQISRVDDEHDTLPNLSGTSTSFTYVPKRAPTYSFNPKGCLRATRTLPEERGIQRTSYPFLWGGPFGLQLRAAFSPAHPLARRDLPLTRARAFRFSVRLFRGVAEAALYCAHRTSTVSPCAFCEQEGHLATPLPILLRPRVARAQETNRLSSLVLIRRTS